MARKSPPEKPSRLDLGELAKGLPGITGQFGASLAEAGGVSLTGQKHNLGAKLKVSGEFEIEFDLHWPKVTAQMRRCWNDQERTTEFGAYGVAFLLILELTDYTVIEQSKKGTGFDYWLGDDDDLFQHKARMEVSGIFSGDDNAIKKRVAIKVKQTERSAGSLPVYVVVVEFGSPRSIMVKRT